MNPLALKAAIWAALTIGAGLSAWALHHHIWQQGYKAGKVELQAEINADAAKALAEARQAEQAARDEQQRIAEQYEQDKANAQATEAGVVADLRGDVIRLRKLWQGCEGAKASVPQAAGAEPQPDDDAELRAEAAARIVRAGIDADNQVIALQAALNICIGTRTQ